MPPYAYKILDHTWEIYIIETQTSSYTLEVLAILIVLTIPYHGYPV